MRPSLPLEVVYSVRLSTWHALFSALGAPGSGRTSSFESLSDVAEALWSAELPEPLVRALHFLTAFTTEAGRTDVYNAAAALGTEARWADAESPADLVALLLAAAPTDAALGELLDAGKVLRNRNFRPISALAYVGARERTIAAGGPRAHARALLVRAEAWARSRDFGRVLPVRFRSDGDAVHFEIAHEGRAEVVVSAPPSESQAWGRGESHPPLVRTTQRPLRSHLLTFEDGGRRLWITTDCLEVATPLAAIAGEVLYADARYFLEVPGADLWRMQELGAAALSVPELAVNVLVQALGGTWLSGKAHIIAQHGRDFFKALERYKIRIEGGRLIQVTVRANVHGSGGPPTCDVAIRPPHQVTVSEPEHVPLLRRFLDQAKITRPEPRPTDFISMQPWIDTREAWVAEEGEAGFAWLLERGILRPDATNRAVASPAHPYAGRTATAHPLRGSKFIAWSADATVAPFVVDEKDLVVYALSFANLARTIASALGLEGPAEKLDDDGVLYCGRRALATTHALLFLPTRPMRAATVARLREAAAHGHAVLITPPGRRREQGLREIAMPKLAGPWHPLLGALVRALHVEAFVDTTLYATEGARVVLHRSTLRVWIDGVPCTLVTEMQFRMLEILVVHAGQTVHTKDIAVHIAGGKFHEDTTRRALEGLVTAIEKSFKAQKKKPPKVVGELIETPKRGYYALRVPGFVD